MRIEPRSIGSRPARQRSSVDFPAPFGPRTATSSPGSTVEPRRRDRACPDARPIVDVEAHRSPVIESSGTGRLPPSQRSRSPIEHGERHRDQEQAEDQRLRRVGLRAEVGRQRHRLGRAGEVAGERDRGAELAERPGPRQHRAGDERRADRGERDPPERVPARRTERAGGVVVAGVELAQGGLDGEHEERHGHERLGDHDGRGRERQPDVEPAIEVLADAGPAARGRRTARRRRRPAAAPSTACTTPARCRARGSRRGPAATPAARRTRSESPVAHSEQTIDSRSAVRTSASERISQASRPRRPPEQPDEREREERDGDDGEHQRRDGQSPRPDPCDVDRPARRADASRRREAVARPGSPGRRR